MYNISGIIYKMHSDIDLEYPSTLFDDFGKYHITQDFSSGQSLPILDNISTEYYKIQWMKTVSQTCRNFTSTRYGAGPLDPFKSERFIDASE